MPRNPRKYLEDMLAACEFLAEFTAGKTVDHYVRDQGFAAAVERKLQIIGEALMQLDRAAPELADRIPEKRTIISFRHVLVHGYDEIRPSVVWHVVEEKLPALRVTLGSLLRGSLPPNPHDPTDA